VRIEFSFWAGLCAYLVLNWDYVKLRIAGWKERLTNQYVEMIIEYSGFLNPYDMTFLNLGIWLRYLSNKSNWRLNFKKGFDFLTFPSILCGHVKYKFLIREGEVEDMILYSQFYVLF